MKWIRVICVLLVAFMLSFNGIGQTPLSLEWAKGFGGENMMASSGLELRLGLDNALYVRGTLWDTTDVDPGPSVYLLGGQPGVSPARNFVAKYDSAGNFLWAGQVYSGVDAGIACMENDKYDNLYVGGWFSDTVWIETGTATAMYYSPGTDAFFAKYDKHGILIWVKLIQAGSGRSCRVRAIDIDGDNNIFIAGAFEDSVDFDPDPLGVVMGTGKGAYFAKYDSNGVFNFAKTLPGDGEILEVKIASSGSVFIGGEITDTVDFDPGSGTAIRWPETGSSGWGLSRDFFLGKYDATGNLDWVNVFGGEYSDRLTALELDGSDNVFIAGVFSDTVDFDPSSGSSIFTTNSYSPSSSINDIYLSKYDTTGALLWAHGFWSDSMTSALIALPEIVFSPASQSVYIMGRYRGVIDFDPSPDTLVKEASVRNTFLAWYDEGSGALKNVELLGSEETGSRFLDCYGLDVGDNDEVFVTGWFQGKIDCEPGPDSTILVSEGVGDIFLAKYQSHALVSADAHAPLEDFVIYPNPTTGIVNVRLKNSPFADLRLSIVDMHGRRIVQEELEGEVDNTSYSIDLSNFPSGMYFMTVTGRDVQETRKLIKY